ncbi:MAG: hypothetical protein WCD89_17035 [Anaerocolumna sp.]
MINTIKLHGLVVFFIKKSKMKEGIYLEKQAYSTHHTIATGGREL